MEKVFWKIDEVAKLVGENASTLRFWETEFRHLKPRTNGKKTRFYTQKNIDDIKIIQHLLRDQKLTIEGAKERIRSKKNQSEKTQKIAERLKEIREELSELRKQFYVNSSDEFPQEEL